VGEARGARHYQWSRDGEPIPGATGSTFTTGPATAADSGSRYTVTVTGACAASTETSADALLTVLDNQAPIATVVSPSGGEFWLLSPADGPELTQQVTWTMSDDIRVCA